MPKLNFISSDSEMGKYISQKDWITTSTGEPQTWPQYLRTTLDIILTSNISMIFFWSEELICFFNDQFQQSFLKDEDLQFIIGESAAEGLPMILDKVNSQVSRTMSGEGLIREKMSLPSLINGNIEELPYTLNFIPIHDGDNNVAGVLLSCMENSRQSKEVKMNAKTYVDGVDQGRVLLEESERMARALVNNSPFPMALQIGEEMRVELANQAIMDVWGKGNDVIGKSLRDLLPELENQKILAKLEEVYKTGIPFHAKNQPVELVKNGSFKTYVLDFSFLPYFDTAGRIMGVIHSGADVTDLYLTKKKIEESEQRFRKVADTAPALIWMSGTDKLCHFFNTGWLNFTGRTLEEEYGNGWTEGVHPDDYDRCLEIYSRSFDQRKDFSMEYRLKRHDGEYRWLADSAVPRFSGDGAFEGYIGACIDIHEQVINRQKLKENDEKLNLIIEASELGIVEIDLVLKKFKYSDKFLEIFGYTPPVQITHEEILDRLHPEDKAVREEAFNSAAKTGNMHYVARYIWNDGSTHWIEAQGRMFFDAEKKPAKLIGTIRDITEEKIRQQELLESEQKFRLLADSINQLIWTFDAEGNLNYFNQFVYEYSRIEPEIMYDNGWAHLIHPEDLPDNIALWMESISTGKDFVCEHRLRRHDGIYRWHLCRAIPQRDLEGQIQMWVCTSTDIHDQIMFVNELEKQVHERTGELEKKNAELVRINKELQSFAYISSHDLQEPLRKIQIFSSRIMEKEFQNLSENGKDNFKRMKNSAERMQALILDLLTYSRTTTEIKLFEKVDMAKIVEEVKEELHEEIELSKASVIENGLCELYVVPFQIRQLFYNLISNSLKFSKKDIKPIIEISSEIDYFENDDLEKGKKYCHIKVSDNGIGFDPRYNEKVFEVFQRLHGQNDYKGTGIGLAIVKKIVENHHGFITAKGEIDKGVEFDIYLPVE